MNGKKYFSTSLIFSHSFSFVSFYVSLSPSFVFQSYSIPLLLSKLCLSQSLSICLYLSISISLALYLSNLTLSLSPPLFVSCLSLTFLLSHTFDPFPFFIPFSLLLLHSSSPPLSRECSTQIFAYTLSLKGRDRKKKYSRN